MELNDMILGFLDWKPATGYELKGLFYELDFLPWSGNNNQIYKALVELEKQELVRKEVIHQENYPSKKRYSVTEAGRMRLREAVLQDPGVPSMQNDFMLHLSWTKCLGQKELLDMIKSYQKRIEEELAYCREKIRRNLQIADRTEREQFIWGMIGQRRADFLQDELNWLVRLQNGMANKEEQE